MVNNSILEQRIRNEGKYIVKNKSTVRQAAKEFNVSKSTLHTDITVRLASIDVILYFAVKEVLRHNKMTRHIRGGEATKRKYLAKT